MKYSILLFYTILFFFNAEISATEYYVSPTGNDLHAGTLAAPFKTLQKASDVVQAGDIVTIRGGIYRNSDFNDGDIWAGANALTITANGNEDNYIIFRAYQNEKVIIEFDANYGIFIKNSSYIKISGLEVKGIGNLITYNEAVAAWGLYKDESGMVHDLATELGIDPSDPLLLGSTITKNTQLNSSKPSYYNGRGIVVNNCHHIEINNNIIRDVPSSAIRVQGSDYTTVKGNEVFHCTYYTTQGVGAVTVAEASVLPISDTSNDIKIRILNNKVYENENKLVSWNPTKTFISFVIDEGSGIFLTRNHSADPNNNYNNGKIQIANNLSYKNGASGIVCHFTNNAIIEHNTVFNNGENNSGSPGGIGLNQAENVLVRNNIAYAKPNKFAIGKVGGTLTNVRLDSNLVYNQNGTQTVTSNIGSLGYFEADPLFLDAANANFRLASNSPAVNRSDSQSGLLEDFYQAIRTDPVADIGAVECIHLAPIHYIQTGPVLKHLVQVQNHILLNTFNQPTSFVASPLANFSYGSIRLEYIKPNTAPIQVLSNHGPVNIFGMNGANFLGELQTATIGEQQLICTVFSQANGTGEILYKGIFDFNFSNSNAIINGLLSSKNLFCDDHNNRVSVYFTSSEILPSENNFWLMISDKNGNFINGQVIGSTHTSESGVVSGKLPADLESGENYRLKVYSDHVAVYSESINILYKPSMSVNLLSADDDVLFQSQKTASEYIVASNKVIKSGKAAFIAGKSISLEPGFEADASSVFETKIETRACGQVQLGFNQNWSFMPDIDLYNSKKMAALKPGLIRYPGGTVAHSWDWRAGRMNNQNNTLAHPLANVQYLYNQLSIDYIFVLDILNRTLEDQIEMLDSIQNLGIPIKYIELGNELYANDSVYIAAFPSGNNYAEKVNIWYPVLKNRYPNALIAALLFGRKVIPNNSRMYNWNNQVVGNINEIDAYTYHIYIGENTDFLTIKDNFDEVRSMANTGNTALWITEYGNMHSTLETNYYDELSNLANYLEGIPNVSILLNHLIFGNNFGKYDRPNGNLTPEGELYIERAGGLD